ncbi:MAG: peptidoglycan DD-metalloendopeptidase family protein [Betaproteobacteria bacterium]|nr:peptidoglycan DD-metalloendopeptidase family protein [Betaproteobacteria bacterium]
MPARAAHAAPASRDKATLDALRARIRALREELDRKEANRREARDALRGSEQAISDANRALRALGAQERTLRDELKSNAAARAAARAALARQQQALGRLLVARERGGAPDALRLLLSGEEPAELQRRLYYLAQASRAVARLVQSVRAQLAELARLKGEAEDRGARLAAVEAQQRAERDRLLAERRAREHVLERLAGEIRDKRRRMQAMVADERRLARVVREIGRVLRAMPGAGYARVERVPQPGEAQGPFASLRGKLHLPVRGELTGRFGTPRMDGGPEFKGVFIRAPEGAPVRAVADGRVVFADWMRGFGNLLIVDHGEGYMSIYADNETLLKQTGEHVTAGEEIATVGSTGGNAQSGLYFELRHLGKAFDPLRWVKLK